jgi:hypothetical protein
MPEARIKMNTSRRIAISFLVAAVILFLGILFWPYILNNIIEPIALVIWFLLRILVLGIHQKYFWYVVIFVAFIYLFRMPPMKPSEVQTDVSQETNTTIINIAYWRGLFIYNGQSIEEEKTLKRELIHLLTSLYASKQSTSNSYAIHDGMQQGKIPLPENIHSFLFSQESPLTGNPLKKFFQSSRKTFRQRIRQWTGQEKAERYQLIDEVLNFMESSLEIKNDDRKPT